MDVDFKHRSAAILFTLFTSTAIIVTSTPDTNVTTVLCNSATYTAGHPFATSLAYILDELESTTPKSHDYDFYDISPYPNAFAYGHGSCDKSLVASDCALCLGAAKTAMLGSCQARIGARGVLRDCQIRYEQYPFSD